MQFMSGRARMSSGVLNLSFFPIQYEWHQRRHEQVCVHPSCGHIDISHVYSILSLQSPVLGFILGNALQRK